MSQVPGKLSTFTAAFLIDVKACNQLNLTDLQDWLGNNVQTQYSDSELNDHG